MYVMKQLTSTRKKILQSRTQNELETGIQTNDTIEKPDFFDIDETFNNHITRNHKNFDLYLIKGDIKLGFDGEF